MSSGAGAIAAIMGLLNRRNKDSRPNSGPDLYFIGYAEGVKVAREEFKLFLPEIEKAFQKTLDEMHEEYRRNQEPDSRVWVTPNTVSVDALFSANQNPKVWTACVRLIEPNFHR